MIIDLERLAVDADYWDEVAPEGASHLIDEFTFTKWEYGQEFSWDIGRDTAWVADDKSYPLSRYLNEGDKWKVLAKPTTSKSHTTDTQPAESGAQISAEWENGIPPAGWHGECTWGNKENSHECVILPDLKIAINFYTSWSVDQISQLEGVEFRPIRSQAEREREPVIIAALRAADPPADDEIHPRQYLIDSLNILYDAGMLRMPDEDVAKNARGES
jgi:hypothetical protein